MILSNRLGLKKPEVNDDIQLTITGISETFQKIDDSYDEVIPDIKTFLTAGLTYVKGKKFWNNTPVVGGYAGWVNIRTGVHAPSWIAGTTYGTGDKVTLGTDNGHYYECVIGGTSGVTEPTFSSVTDSLTNDLNGSSAWVASYAYVLNDIVVATVGDKSYYYKCIVAGASGATEPSWTSVSGSTIVDGSVQWYAYKTVQWKEHGTSCEFIQFSKVGQDATPDTTPITSLGTVTVGAWQATAIDVAHGGTGATDVKTARTNLGATTKFSKTVGNGVSTTIVVDHNLGTQDIVVSVRETVTPSGIINPDIAVIDNNSITITFVTAPTTDQYRVVVIG